MARPGSPGTRPTSSAQRTSMQCSFHNIKQSKGTTKMSESDPSKSRGLKRAHTIKIEHTDVYAAQPFDPLSPSPGGKRRTSLHLPLGKLNANRVGKPNLRDDSTLQEFNVTVGATTGTVIGQLDPVRGNVNTQYPRAGIGPQLFVVDSDGEIT